MKQFFIPGAVALVILLSAQSPPPSPAPTGASPNATPTASYCPVTVSRVETLDDGHTISFGLHSLIGSGRASGTITAYVGNDRYAIPFREKYATDDDVTAVPNPIVVHFANPVRIWTAAVDSLDDPSPGPCIIMNPFIDDQAVTGTDHVPSLQKLNADGFIRASLLAEPIRAPEPTTDPVPECETPYAPAAVVKTVPPLRPAIVQFAHVTATVPVLVTIGSDGVVLNARVNPPKTLLDNASLYAAQHSTYRAGIYRCEPTATQALFVIRFT